MRKTRRPANGYHASLWLGMSALRIEKVIVLYNSLPTKNSHDVSLWVSTSDIKNLSLYK